VVGGGCRRRGGAADGWRVVGVGLGVAGNTGTSQVGWVVVNNREGHWTGRDDGRLGGYAPFDSPRFAGSVVVEHGGGGSSAAAPIARDVLARAMHGAPPPMDVFPRARRGEISRMWDQMPLRQGDGTGTGSDRA